MERIIWRWMWRFFAVAAALTVVLSVAAGIVLAHMRIKPAPWFGMVVMLVAALMAAGGLLPAMQHDVRKHFPRPEANAAASEPPPPDGTES